MSKQLRKFEENQMRDGENILLHVDGYIGKMMGKGDDTQHNGVLILTGDRVVFYSKSWLSEVVKSIQLKQIANVHYNSTWPGTTIEIVAKDTLKVTTLGKKEDFANFQAQLEEIRDKIQPNVAGGPTAPAAEDIPTQIQKLASLKDAGILTEEEFAAKKAELLAKM